MDYKLNFEKAHSRLLTPEEKIDSLKSNFAHNCVKWDFEFKNGENYCLGYIGKSIDDAEWRIWKTRDGVSKSQNVDYLFESHSQEEAQNRFVDILKGSVEK
jgi:hypothetical protein